MLLNFFNLVTSRVTGGVEIAGDEAYSTYFQVKEEVPFSEL